MCWERRVGDVRDFSLHIAGQAPTGPEPPVTVAAIGKGAIPQPRLMKAAITQGAPASAAMTAFGFMDWVSAHPLVTVALATVGLCAVGATVHRLDQWHRTQQEAPSPGLVSLSSAVPFSATSSIWTSNSPNLTASMIDLMASGRSSHLFTEIAVIPGFSSRTLLP